MYGGMLLVVLCGWNFVIGTLYVELCSRMVLVEHYMLNCAGGTLSVERCWWNGVGGSLLVKVLVEQCWWNIVCGMVLVEQCW